MKAPKIVQSYWSKAYQNTPNSGWAFRESHYMSWALSCLQLKQFYDEIELVTDSEGADLLINKLHLPYTSCLTILDKLKNENPAIWALGKIAAYEVQQEPFIHVDGDIYIWTLFLHRTHVTLNISMIRKAVTFSVLPGAFSRDFLSLGSAACHSKNFASQINNMNT